MKESRHFPRYRTAVVVDFTWRDSRMTGLTWDVSLEGMFVRTSRPPQEGQPVRITLRFATGELPIQGIVVRAFHAPALDRESPTGFAVAVRNEESYRQFVKSVALAA